MLVSLLPLTSVTVSVTVFIPKSSQLKAVVSKVILAIPQASDEPLSISAVVIDALPLASNCTVISCVTTVGATVSCTVTVAVAVLVLPLGSVPVIVTVLVPISAQLKLNGVAVNTTLQSSLLPLFKSAGVIVAIPLASNCTVMSCETTVGAILSSIVNVLVIMV